MEHGDYLNYDPNWPTINMTYLHPQPAVELGNFRYALMFNKKQRSNESFKRRVIKSPTYDIG